MKTHYWKNKRKQMIREIERQIKASRFIGAGRGGRDFHDGTLHAFENFYNMLTDNTPDSQMLEQIAEWIEHSKWCCEYNIDNDEGYQTAWLIYSKTFYTMLTGEKYEA